MPRVKSPKNVLLHAIGEQKDETLASVAKACKDIVKNSLDNGFATIELGNLNKAADIFLNKQG